MSELTAQTLSLIFCAKRSLLIKETILKLLAWNALPAAAAAAVPILITGVLPLYRLNKYEGSFLHSVSQLTIVWQTVVLVL